MRERAKLAPEFGVRLGKFGVQSQQMVKVFSNLIEPGQTQKQTCFVLLLYVPISEGAAGFSSTGCAVTDQKSAVAAWAQLGQSGRVCSTLSTVLGSTVYTAWPTIPAPCNSP